MSTQCKVCGEDISLKRDWILLSLSYANLTHRGLKLDGAIGQGEICNSLKSENS